MADPEDEITANDLRDFIISRGGKVKNVELVTHYSYFLKHSSNKEHHKKRFSQLVNEFATVKNTEGEKYIVLKKKYRKQGAPLTFVPPPIDGDTPRSSRQRPQRGQETGAGVIASDVINGNSRNGSVRNGHGNGSALTSHGAGGDVGVCGDSSAFEDSGEVFDSERGQDRLHGAEPGQEEDRYEERVTVIGRDEEEPVEPSSESLQQSAPLPPPDIRLNDNVEIEPPEPNGAPPPPIQPEHELDLTPQIESVNKVADTFDEEKVIQELAGPEAPKKIKLTSVSKEPEEKRGSPDSESANHHEEDEDTPHLGALGRRWMLASAHGKVEELNELLKQDPTLITKRDFISGLTVMHWGAKLGKKEMIRMAIENGIDVNMRTQGGYTALHIAAMHNREAIMQLLTTDYNANIEMRDYSGRKPHHHLKSTASSYIKSKLDTTHTYDGFSTPCSRQRHASSSPPATPLSSKFQRVFRSASVYLKRPAMTIFEPQT